MDTIRPFKPRRQWKWKSHTTKANKIIEKWLQHQEAKDREYMETGHLEIFRPGQVEADSELERLMNMRDYPDRAEDSYYPNKRDLDILRHKHRIAQAYKRAQQRREAAVAAYPPAQRSSKWMSTFENTAYHNYTPRTYTWDFNQDFSGQMLGQQAMYYENANEHNVVNTLLETDLRGST